MDPKETLRRIAPHVVAAIETGDGKSLEWGMVPRTNGRVFVRMFSLGWGQPTQVEVRLDRVPVWRAVDLDEEKWEWEWNPYWVPAPTGRGEREAERAESRARQAARDADRHSVIEAIREGRPVLHWEGQHGYGGTLTAGTAVASARGIYRALTNRTLQITWEGMAAPEWRDWLAEVTNPPAPAPAYLPRRLRRDPVAFDMMAAG